MRKSMLVAVAILGLVALGWWAGRVTITSPMVQEEQEQQEIWATATTTSVGSSLPAGVLVQIEYQPFAVNHLTGVVTQIDPGEKHEGEVLYTVGQTPVRVITSSVPAWRDLELGSKGDDVKDLQNSLIAQGYLSAGADGNFGAATSNAVKAWQRDLGIAANGRIALGEVINVPELPLTLRVSESITLGSMLNGGETAAVAPSSDRAFSIHLTEQQATGIPHDAEIVVEHLEHRWPAVIAETVPNTASGGTVLLLAAPDGGAVCQEACDSLPTDPEINLRSTIQLVPSTHGVGIPAAAVHTRPDMTTYVVTRAGETDVTVQAAGQGLVVVEGLDEGIEVLLSGLTE